MKCINCNQEIDDNNKFCNHCGTMQPLDRETYVKEHPEIGTATNDEGLNPPPSPIMPPTPSMPPSQQPPQVPDTQNGAGGATPGGSTHDGSKIQCPECGKMNVADSLYCQYCGCTFAASRQPHHVGGYAPSIPPTNPAYGANDNDYDSHYRPQPKKPGMSGGTKALITTLVLMLLAAIGGGLYYFYFYNNTKLIPDNDYVSFSRKGGEKTVTFTTNAKDVEITKYPNWVTVELGDGEIVIKCHPLDDYEDREGIIKLKAGNTEARIRISQSASATQLNISQDIIKTGYKGETVEIELDTDGDPATTNFNISDHYLCSISNKSRTGFTVNIEENPSTTPREGTITIDSGGMQKTLTIIQAGMCSFCDATGEIPCPAANCDEGKVSCSNCGGGGMIYIGYNSDTRENIYILCEECNGNGYTPCEICNGRGHYTCDHCNGTGNNFTKEESF